MPYYHSTGTLTWSTLLIINRIINLFHFHFTESGIFAPNVLLWCQLQIFNLQVVFLHLHVRLKLLSYPISSVCLIFVTYLN